MIVARGGRVQDRLARGRPAAHSLVSHWGFMHFFLGVTLFGEEFAPRTSCLCTASRTNSGVSIFERLDERRIDGARFGGWP